MKLFRNVLLIAALSLSGCLSAQAQVIDTSLNETIRGRAGKMIIFKAVPGMSEITLSRNDKFMMGKSISEEGDAGVGIIYEIATGRMERVNGSVVEVVDWDNFVTTQYAKIDGKEYADYVGTCNRLKSGAVEEASADLLTLSVSAYLSGESSSYGNVLVETKTGKILDTLKTLDPTVAGGMNMGWQMSDDAKIVAGRAALTDASMNYTPTFWDLTRDTVYCLSEKYVNGYGQDAFRAGQMWGVSGDGTVVCGEIQEQACYVKYDRTTGTYTSTKYIAPRPGYSASWAYRSNNSGVMVGVDQISTQDIFSRQPFIYFSDKDEKYILADYLQNLYGLDGEKQAPLFTTTGISDDGRLISGHHQQEGVYYAYLIMLDEHQSYAPVRNTQIENVPRRSLNVVVSWQEPMKGEYTVTGYNIYRDKQKIGSVGVNTLTYTDTVRDNGKYKYFVQAVYGDKESYATDTLSIIVMDPNSCLPVLEMFSSVEYNRKVSLAWGQPSDQETQNIINRPKGSSSKYIPQEGLDFVSVFQPITARMSAGVHVGDYIYTGSNQASGIFVYDQFGNTIRQIAVEGVPDVLDMAYHEKDGEGYFYVATGLERVVVAKLNPKDPLDITPEYSFIPTIKAVSIAYVENTDPDINNGQDYLIVGDYYNFVAYPFNATGPDDEFAVPVKLDNRGMIISGIEYYKGRLYASDQNGVNGCDLAAFDMATGKKLFTTDLYAHPVVEDASNALGWPNPVYAGGLTHSTLKDGTVVLECLLQSTYSYNMIVDMELESSDDILGYVVYRKDCETCDYKPVTDTLKARHFAENIDTAGTYTYYVKYFSTRGCSSSSKDFDVTATEVIVPKGNVAPPLELRAYESNGNAVLTWSEECLGMDGFVGFNLYRDGKQIGGKNFLNVRYTDSEVKIGTKYQYILTAFFDDSSETSDTTEITLTGKGTPREPAAFDVVGALKKDDNTVDVTATWGLPYFEEPMAYGYCGYPAYGNSLTGTSQMFCIVGWNEEDMDKFDDDLYLVGVEFVMACPSSGLKSMNTIVYVNDVLVYNKPYEDRFQSKEWVRVYFDKVFKMKQEEEIAVGYSVSYDPAAVSQDGIFFCDMGPRVVGKSDLISVDGQEYNTLYILSQGQIDANICINALVVRLRDLEAAASAPDPQEYLMRKTVRMDMKAELGKGKKFADAPKTSSEGIKFVGFNFYRDGKKLNDTIMRDFSYEENVAKGEYDYEVGAVYEGAEEIKASFFADFSTVDAEELEQAYGVSVYPNPVSDRLNIKGDYVSFMLVDMNGRVLMRDVRNTESVSLDGLNNGVYFVMITLPNGDKRAVKVIKR